MEIKQVVLQSEKDTVIKFLDKFSLKYKDTVDYTVYAEENGEIVGTVSLSGNTIMLLAVDEKMQGENLAVALVDHAIKKLREDKVYGYKVFTKLNYTPLFESMGFRLLVKTDDFVALEGGECDISKTVDAIAFKVATELGGIDKDTASIVINGNPFTEGHLKLCEHALKNHKKLIIFVLEEDLSEFSFKERFSLTFLATRPYADRVSVVPSTEYIVSKSTFPDYFLKSVDASTKAYAEYDALIFKNYFMGKLGICKRYFGAETTDYMQAYNKVMQSVLGKQMEVVERFEKDGEVISAKAFRQLVKDGKVEQALNLIPISCRAVMRLILKGKNV